MDIVKRAQEIADKYNLSTDARLEIEDVLREVR